MAVGVDRMLGRDDSVKTASLWIGYVGLCAMGVALWTTAWWIEQGSRSFIGRAALRALLGVGIALWLIAIVFPFL